MAVVNPQIVEVYLTLHRPFFPEELLPYLEEKFLRMDSEEFQQVASVKLKDPVTLLAVSLLLGGFGVDRFLLGETGCGIVKLLLCWTGVLTVVDWFQIKRKTREYNFRKISVYLHR